MSGTLNVAEYVRKDGSSPYRTWFDGVHAQAAAKVTTAVERLELGNTSRVKWIGAIGEYRIDWGPGYRIYIAKDSDTLIILLGDGTKERQRIDIERAKAMWAEYKARKTAAAKSKRKR